MTSSPDIQQPVTAALHLCGELLLSVGQLSSAGIKPVNEDAIGIRIPEGDLLTTKGAVAVIADGVSAAEAGRESSEASVSNFLSDYFSTPESWSVKKSAQQVLTALNRWLYGQGQGYADSRRGYVTTFSAIIIKSHTVHILHAGDSRVYRLRAGELEQLSRDHSAVISENRTYLTRALGMDVKLDVDYRQLPVEEGDVYLLSTDGLHDVLPQAELKARMLTLGSDLEVACDEFCQRALEQGSTDNISCQLLRIEALPPLAMDEVVGRMTQLSFPPFLEAGMKLDGYRVKRELHASNRSQVYLVEDEASGKLYCMKTPSVNFDDDPAYIERFVMESWIGSRISSPYVVKVYEAVRNRSCLYYLTEYVDGMSLTQWMRENPKPPIEEVVYLVDQIAKGLRAFHRRETLHSDIKPDNVMIDSQGRVKIIDFGACHVAGIAEIATPFQRDIALGTASYSAPEYSLGKLPNYRADLFSLAVICYEMLTGALPFEGKLENCKSQGDFLNTRYIPSYQLNPLVPVWIDGALRKGLRFYEERRHQEVSEFVYELQNPNPRYLEHGKRPLMERDPLLFWKVLAGGLALSQLIMLYFLK